MQKVILLIFLSAYEERKENTPSDAAVSHQINTQEGCLFYDLLSEPWMEEGEEEEEEEETEGEDSE